MSSKSIPINDLKKVFQYPNFLIQFNLSEKLDRQAPLVSFVLQDSKQHIKEIQKNFPSFNAQKSQIVQTKSEIYIGLGLLKKISIHNLGELFLRVAPQIYSLPFSTLQVTIDSEVINHVTWEHTYQQLIVAIGNTSYSTALLKTDTSNTSIHKKTNTSSKNTTLKKIIFIHKNGISKNLSNKTLSETTSLLKHINAVRQVQSLPSNYLTPVNMEARANYLAKQYKLKFQSFGTKELQKMKAFGILAVHQGSTVEPRVIQLEYIPPQSQVNKKKIPTLVLVGKGVTFDTGGTSLKPSLDMHEMKFDMSGSAVVVHAIAAIAELKLPVRVVALVGMVENIPGGNALKPGDVYTSMKGITVEVQNTDAEGRLVLADLLYYAESKFKPDLIIDLATLTGACIIALGNAYAGVFSRQQACLDFIKQASLTSAEPVWALPMGPSFEAQLKSDIADYNNIGGRAAGSSTAATFLSFFVNETTKWVHLDIAGMAYSKKGFGVYPTIARGYGIRLLTQVARKLTNLIHDSK